MPQAEHTVVVPAPIAEVFSFFADPRNDPLWRPGVREMSLPSGTLGTAGATYRQRAAGPFGGTIECERPLVPRSELLCQFEALPPPLLRLAGLAAKPLVGGLHPVAGDKCANVELPVFEE